MSVYNLISLAGLVFLMAVAWAFSEDRRRVNWRLIGWGTLLQLLLGALVFLLPGSTTAFLCLTIGAVAGACFHDGGMVLTATQQGAR
jgi:CNT family concentrative nucleoside transporter